MIDVCLLGTGGTMPLPYRALTSLFVKYNGHGFLIDCGEGTQVQMRVNGLSFYDIDVICFTHYHADHITGLTGLLLSMALAGKKTPVTILGPSGLERIVKGLLVAAPELPFEINLISFKEKDFHINFFGMDIDAFRVKHNVECYAYTFTLNRKGIFLVDKAKELNVPVQQWKVLQNGDSVVVDGKTITSDMVLGPARKGIKLTYCTDTRPTKRIEEMAQYSDLFVCEGMYCDEDKISDAKAKTHMMMQEACQIAKDAKVETLWLTHFSPSISYPNVYNDVVKSILKNVIIPKDGQHTCIKFID